jgi:hypothetical protein
MIEEHNPQLESYQAIYAQISETAKEIEQGKWGTPDFMIMSKPTLLMLRFLAKARPRLVKRPGFYARYHPRLRVKRGAT